MDGHVASEMLLSDNNLDQVTSNISSNLARPSVQHVGKRQLSHDQQNSALTQVYAAIAVKNQIGGQKQSSRFMKPHKSNPNNQVSQRVIMNNRDGGP